MVFYWPRTRSIHWEVTWPMSTRRQACHHSKKLLEWIGCYKQGCRSHKNNCIWDGRRDTEM